MTTIARHRLAVLTVSAWVVGVVVMGLWQISRHIDGEHARYGAEFDKAYAVVAQRLDQNEALLDGLVALLRSSRDREFPELRQYANEMLLRYAHLYTVGYQPRVSLAERALFEQRMSQHTGQPFRIRDFALSSERRWRDAPARPHYFPVTFMAPALVDAQSVIGLDVYKEPSFRSAIDRSALRDEPLATAPFDLVEGGRGYIYLRALRMPGSEHTRNDPAAPADHLISLLIRADRLLAGIAPPASGRMELLHRDVDGHTAALIGALGGERAPQAGPSWRAVLPAWHMRRALRSGQQPFDLVATARPRWRDAPLGPWAQWLGAWTALCLAAAAAAASVVRARRVRQVAEAQAALAQRDLAANETRAALLRERSLDELGAGIAHELNQPLTAVVGYSQAALRLLGDAASPTPQQLEAVRDALQANAQQALRAGALMQRLRALVRRRPVQLQTVVVQDLVAAALRLEHERSASGGVRIDVRAPTPDLALSGDALLLEQLFVNVLRNALEALAVHAGAAPRIAIDIDFEDKYCRIAFSDNGPGMTDQQLALAFHPFQSTKPEGIGIGLVVCAAIVQAHGGDICALRSDMGGACIVIRLPWSNTLPTSP